MASILDLNNNPAFILTSNVSHFIMLFINLFVCFCVIVSAHSFSWMRTHYPCQNALISQELGQPEQHAQQ